MSNDKPYDFKGWATKSNILVSDGVIIHSDAFAKNDNTEVPLVWNHQRNSPENILGHVVLTQYPEGTYAHGFFNDTEAANAAKVALEHGDISAMSIGANHIKRQGNQVVGGHIFEVSLVVAGANPGALIEEVVTHGDAEGESAIIYNGLLIHSASDDVDETKGNTMAEEPKVNAGDNPEPTQETEQTAEEILATLTPVQMAVVDSLVDALTDDGNDDNTEEDTGKEPTMQHNAFQAANGATDNTELLHSDLNKALQEAIDNRTTLKSTIEHSDIMEHADGVSNGVTNIEELFPDAKTLNTPPIVISDPNTATEEIIAGVSRSPFSRVKNLWTDVSDMNDEQARAKGYIKGTQKVESVIKVAKRSTEPALIYVKNKLDRQDILDITDFNVVPWMQSILLQKLKDELARAILIGDGRTESDKYKIDETKIRPILTDDALFTVKTNAAGLGDFVEKTTLGMGDLFGSGAKSLYINPKTLKRMLLQRDAVGGYIFGSTAPSQAALAATLGVSKIVESSFLPATEALVGSLADYQIGNTKGGEITNFDDFDIDFNQYKYLTETYLSGALVNPKSFLRVTIGDAVTIPTFVVHNIQDNYVAPKTV